MKGTHSNAHPAALPSFCKEFSWLWDRLRDGDLRGSYELLAPSVGLPRNVVQQNRLGKRRGLRQGDTGQVFEYYATL